MLERMYPNIQWNNISLYDGMPWFMYFSNAIGTVLPYTFSFNKLHIYIKDYQKLNPDYRLAIVVHELIHVTQYESFLSSSKFQPGYFKKFLIIYIAWYFKCIFNNLFKLKMPMKTAFYNAYRLHPMETPAYQQEYFFNKTLDHYKAHEPAVFFKTFPQLIYKTSIINHPGLFYVILSGLIILPLFVIDLVFSILFSIIIKIYTFFKK